MILLLLLVLILAFFILSFRMSSSKKQTYNILPVGISATTINPIIGPERKTVKGRTFSSPLPLYEPLRTKRREAELTVPPHLLEHVSVGWGGNFVINYPRHGECTCKNNRPASPIDWDKVNGTGSKDNEAK